MHKQIGNRIKELRKDKSLSQEQVAEKIGISKQQYTCIENGNGYISLKNLVKIADVFGITVKDITDVLEQKSSLNYNPEEQKQSTINMLNMIDLFYANKNLYEKIKEQNNANTQNTNQPNGAK